MAINHSTGDARQLSYQRRMQEEQQTFRRITASTVEDEDGKRYSIFPLMSREEEKVLRESPRYHPNSNWGDE